MNPLRRVAVALAVVAGVGVGAACVGSTGSPRFAFEARAGGAPREGSGPLRFTNEVGWDVTLERADVTLGPIYLNVVAPLGAQSLRELFVKTAWAHGESHLSSGRVVGEVLAQVRFDALSPSLVPFPVVGAITQEQVRTAEVWYYPEPGVSPDTTKIDTVALDVAGAARRGDRAVRFRGKLILDDAWQRSASSGSRGAQSIAEIRRVRGIASSFYPREGGHLEITFDVKRLFRGADFDNLASNPSDKDGTKILVQSKTGKFTTDQVMQNLYQGLREANGTYAVRWVDP